MAFRIYRILCSTSPDVEAERLAAESSLTKFGEHVTFPEQVLFAGASFRPPFDANRHRELGESNVRMCDFFVHIFSENWPGDAFRGFIELAQASKADPSKPMRQLAVLFRNFAKADDKVRGYREVLAGAGDCELRDFLDGAELERELSEIHAGWWKSVQERP